MFEKGQSAGNQIVYLLLAELSSHSDDTVLRWYDMIWWYMAWRDVMWCDVMWYVMWCDMIWSDLIWYDMIYMIWYMIWYDIIWYMIWYDMIWYDIYSQLNSTEMTKPTTTWAREPKDNLRYGVIWYAPIWYVHVCNDVTHWRYNWYL